LAGFFVYIFSPVAIWLLNRFKLTGFDTGLAKLTELPQWYRLLAVVIGGIVEEVLYQGYAVEQLSSLAGSYWIGGSLAVLAFGLAHVPLWGWSPALTTLASRLVRQHYRSRRYQ
jgi:membrane protease YdiL (CAAX protease family)